MGSDAVGAFGGAASSPLPKLENGDPTAGLFGYLRLEYIVGQTTTGRKSLAGTHSGDRKTLRLYIREKGWAQERLYSFRPLPSPFGFIVDLFPAQPFVVRVDVPFRVSR